MAELCRRFQIARKTGYKWLQRYRSEGAAGLADRSRRPQQSPAETGTELVAAILEQKVVGLEARPDCPVCGGRGLRA